MTTIENVIDELKSRKSKNDEAWVAKMDGQVLRFHSGKSMWSKKRIARTALTNHLSVYWSYRRLDDLGYKETSQLTDYLLNEGIVTIEQL